jgi:hypothetical protein
VALPEVVRALNDRIRRAGHGVSVGQRRSEGVGAWPRSRSANPTSGHRGLQAVRRKGGARTYVEEVRDNNEAGRHDAALRHPRDNVRSV